MSVTMKNVEIDGFACTMFAFCPFRNTSCNISWYANCSLPSLLEILLRCQQ